MARGEYKISKQVGPKGYFGSVTLDVREGEHEGGVTVEFDSTHADRWQSGARFGIEYVLEHIPRKRLFPKGVKIHIDSIEGHEVDTTNMLIAYVAANALLGALSFEPKKRPSLDETEGVISFPK